MEDSIETYIKRETKGGGDCAFHAALGAWDPRMKQFEADNVHEKRTRLADAIRNCQPNHNIYPLVKEAIRELLTRNLRGINALNLGMLKKNYEIFIKQNGDAIEQAWIVFEKELQKHDDIIAGIEKFTEDHKRQRELSLENVEKLQILEQKFKNYENENPEGLEAIIRVETKLNEAYQTYKQSLQVLMKSNEDGCERWFESQISKDVLDEYAQYVSRQGEWLLPCELQIIAYVFNIHIRYYTGASANVEEFNPHGEKIIYVRFNGDSHYERMAGDAEIAKANSLSKVVGSLSEEVQESPPVQPADSKISIRDLLLIQLDCTPFRSYQDAVDCYRQAKGTEEGLQVRERLLNLPQYIVHNYCASELKELVHLVSCEDEDITRAVINSLWPLLDMADARYVYGAVLALIRQLQTTGQKCDDACLVDLLGKLLDRLGQELRNLSALDSNNALLALQATASLVDCLYEQGILLGKDFLKPCRDLSLEFVRSFSIAARVSHPLHAFWSNYLQRGLAASEMRLTPYQIQVIQAQRRKALWSTAGHAGEGVLRVALGTGGLAWGILLAATGFAIHGLPDAGVAFAVSLIDCVKCLHKANKSYARVKEADQDLNPRAGVQPATAAQEALGVKENDTDEIKFWQGLQEKVIPIITQARTEPFEVQMLAYTLTGLLKKAGPNRSPEAQEAAETCMKSVQSFFKEAYMQAIHEPTTQRFIMACCEQLHKAGFDFPEWEVGQYANFFLGIHDELENDKPNGPNKRYAQWKIYQAKKDGGQRLSDAEEKEFNRLSPQHGESSGATTPKVLQFLELAYQFSELRPLPDELSAEPLSLIPPPGLRNHWVVEFKQDVKVEDLIKRIVKAHNGTATPSARHEINMEAADTEELERLRNLAPKNQLSAWGKECLKMLTQVPAGEKNHMKKDSSADGAKKFVHKGEINKPTDRYKARLGGVDGVLPPGFSEASTHTLSMVDKVGDSGGAEVSLVVNAPTGEVTSDLFQISMAPSPGAASAPPVSTQQSGAKKAAALLNDFGLFSSTSSAFIIGAEGYYNFNKTDFERSDNPRFKALGDELAALISGYSEDCKTNVTEQQEQIRKKIEEIEDVKSVLQLLKNMLIAGQQPLPIAEEEQNSQKKSEMG